MLNTDTNVKDRQVHVALLKKALAKSLSLQLNNRDSDVRDSTIHYASSSLRELAHTVKNLTCQSEHFNEIRTAKSTHTDIRRFMLGFYFTYITV